MTCPYCGCHSYNVLRFPPKEVDECINCGAIRDSAGWREKEPSLLDYLEKGGQDAKTKITGERPGETA